MEGFEGALGLFFTPKQLAQDLQIPSSENMWHKLVRYKSDVWFRRSVIQEKMTTLALSSRSITGEWAEYSATLPEIAKWKAVAYLLSI